jgi:hypothetical protein
MAAQRNYETPTQNFQPYQMPPPPPMFGGNPYPPMMQQQAPPMNCIKCGDSNNLSIQTFKQDYIPPAVYLGFLVGILLGAILTSIFRVRHQITAPFCGNCWGKFRNVYIIETLTTIGFFFGFLFSIFVGVASESLIVFFIFFAISIGLIVLGQSYKKKNSPKIKKIDRKQVVIDAPVVGEMCFIR